MSVADRHIVGRAGDRLPVAVAVCAVIALLLVTALIGRVLSFDLRRDEMMFLPPAALIGEHPLYSGLFYNHVPYSAWLLRGLHLVLPDLGLLELGRLTICAAWVWLLTAALWFGTRLSGSLVVGAFAALSLLASEVLLGQAGMAATNNLLPLPLALTGLGIFALSLVERTLSFPRLFLAGVMLSLAAGMKISAIAFIPPVAAACLLLPRDLTLAERLRRLFLPCALGAAVGAAPLFWLLATEPTFLSHVVGFHTGPHVAYWRAHAGDEPSLALSLAERLRLGYSLWLAGAPLITLFLALIGLRMAHRAQPEGHGEALQAAAVVAAATVCAAAMALVPQPGFPQYFAPPLISLALLVPILTRALDSRSRATYAGFSAVAAMLLLVIAVPWLAPGLPALLRTEGWTAARVEQGAAALADVLDDAGAARGPVATLAPIYPLEAGLPIFPEFGTGPFAFRIAPFLEPPLRSAYVVAGAEDLPALFEARPPAAVLTGFNPGLEAPLIAWAQARGFVPHPLEALHDRYGEGTVWVPGPAATN